MEEAQVCGRVRVVPSHGPDCPLRTSHGLAARRTSDMPQGLAVPTHTHALCALPMAWPMRATSQLHIRCRVITAMLRASSR